MGIRVSLLIIALTLGVEQAMPGQSIQDDKVRMGIAGLSRDHVHWVLNKYAGGNINLVGIAESDQKLVQRYQQQYKLDDDLFYTSLERMLETVRPNAMLAFNPIVDHLEVVRQCAPRGIHVMVEKPLAINMKHAKEMKTLASEHGIFLLTNYETTWYSSNHKAFEMITEENSIGDIRKIVVHDGHQGPEEIGVSKEFFEWLTDPEKNGGGALIDFGCYGANLITGFMGNQRPLSVTAVTQQIKPEVYPNVDDEANIILTYPTATGIIQASWNWPVNRKDMEIYGKRGYIICKDDNDLKVWHQNSPSPKELELPERDFPFSDPFEYFAALITNRVPLDRSNLSSLENNMIVVEILDAARKSAASGKTITLK